MNLFIFIFGIIWWQFVITFVRIFTNNDTQATCRIAMGFGWIIYYIDKLLKKILFS